MNLELTIIDVIGVAGVAIIIAMYLMLQLEKIDPKSFSFSFLNLIGSLLIVVSLLKNWNLASFIIEFFWIMISVYGLYKFYRRSRL